MCGIVGYIGDCATKNVVEGLKSLEYRGYDSAGVALMKDGYAPFVIKSEGRSFWRRRTTVGYGVVPPSAMADAPRLPSSRGYDMTGAAGFASLSASCCLRSLRSPDSMPACSSGRQIPP